MVFFICINLGLIWFQVKICPEGIIGSIWEYSSYQDQAERYCYLAFRNYIVTLIMNWFVILKPVPFKDVASRLKSSFLLLRKKF